MNNIFGKTVAITGATGGLGRELCRNLASFNANLVLLDRNLGKSQKLAAELKAEFPNLKITHIKTDLEDMHSVYKTAKELQSVPIDIFIHNAGAYSIPRHKCDTGFDNVFQINFVSPYYLIRSLLPNLRKREGARVIVVGSIAHNYSKSDPSNIDFYNIKQASKVYGNAKRYLMFSLYELFKNETTVSLAVTHPGITFTNITNHYPKLIFAIIKHPMKIIFMKPSKACLSIVQGLFNSTGYFEWIGPSLFGIWGKPKKSRLKTCSENECKQIAKTAEEIYNILQEEYRII